MDKWEYKWIRVDEYEMNQLGQDGWHVAPNSIVPINDSRTYYMVLMERKVEVETETFHADDQPVMKRDQPICGASKAAGWGGMRQVCSFDKGHDGDHSWVRWWC